MASTDPRAMSGVLRVIGPLPSHSAKHLHNSLIVHHLHPGEILFWTGSAGGSVFFVESGELSIWWESDGGEQELMRFSSAGDIITPGALLDRSPRRRSCVAEQDARLLELTSAAFVALTAIDTRMAMQVLTSLGAVATGHPDSGDPSEHSSWLDSLPELH